MVGISWITLRRWLAAGKVKPFVAIPFGGRHFYRWTQADIDKLKEYKQIHYRKGRGRKAQSSRESLDPETKIGSRTQQAKLSAGK